MAQGRAGQGYGGGSQGGSCRVTRCSALHGNHHNLGVEGPGEGQCRQAIAGSDVQWGGQCDVNHVSVQHMHFNA